ncbi:alpha-amylase family glycosyl hydrolase [Cyanobium sp. CH-040]|uniref:alpha-amylase family glycosyl hydrolase n=1 Tax=Cyanobium sp. CH-040 TaxID=2823708 RepID=UPI0020CFE046|nr:alpha-amylase family glycosyl hydrolase [Cyanobium sp. CH-040]MCP9927649.1 alpha-glucosidase C-terminal domain-containing protein [Cyanobium sp. CH-040]
MHNVFVMAPEVRAAFENVRRLESHRLEGWMNPRDVDVFWLRFERYFDDLHYSLQALYGDRSDALEQFGRLFGRMVEAYAQRPDALKVLDLERQFTPRWFQRTHMVGYTCYADHFAADLQGVGRRIAYLEELGVTYLHLMPLMQPRPGANDGGYAMADCRRVRPDLGTIDDLRQLAAELRERGITLCLDLVLNHVAREHAWARRALAGEERYLGYFHTFADRSLPDAYERTLPEIFPDDAPGNFTWVPEMADGGRWVWTTFHDYQWDLNYGNPEVVHEIVDLMFFYANLGAGVLRLDAAPFLWKRMGTNCQNQPEVFLLIQAFRAILRVVAPGVIFKAEAIVPPDALIRYLGVKSTVEKQCELAYDNQRMALLWSTLATRRTTLITQALHRAPQLLIGCAPVNYLRNHDDIGWAITDEDLAAVGETPHLHRRFLNAFYTGDFPGSFARGALFQENPDTGDARVTGTTASLAGLEAALERGDEAAIERAIRRILLLHALILGAGGIPVIHMGDELGLTNDPSYGADPLRAGDSRWLNRPRMDWQRARQRHDGRTVPGRLFGGLRRLIEARRATSLFHGFGLFQPLWTGNEHVLAYARKRPEGTVLVLANVEECPQSIEAELPRHAGLPGELRDLLAAGAPPPLRDGRLQLEPLSCRWLVDGSEP